MTNLRQQIIDLLFKESETSYGRGSCGELGDSFQSIVSDDFEYITDKIMDLITPKNKFSKCIDCLYAACEPHKECLRDKI